MLSKLIILMLLLKLCYQISIIRRLLCEPTVVSSGNRKETRGISYKELCGRPEFNEYKA